MGDHELTRRGALAALAAVTGGTVAGLAATTDAPQAGDDPDVDSSSGGDGGPSASLSAHERRTIRLVARTLYPSDVSNVDAFVETYLDGLAATDPDRIRGIAEAVALLDDHARGWHDVDLVELDTDMRDLALRRFGLQRIDPDPDGTPVARVRHYLVDELLLALYASPTGGDLVGLPNPPGHPGGLASYTRGPESE